MRSRGNVTRDSGVFFFSLFKVTSKVHFVQYTSWVKIMAQQQGVEGVSYYDIMVIGKTGQGKSTTADKLLIANPTGQDYSQPQFEEPKEQDGKLKAEDLSMWLLSKKSEEAVTHLKSLVYFRSKDAPHKLVNKARNAGPNGQVFLPTSNCEVISNDTTRVRVLDVPGFFGCKSTGSSLSPLESLHNIGNDSLCIMRKILHVQTALGMKFQRILYFLPVRGPLERADAVLQSDLKVMAHFFGKSILQCMVLVATVSAHISMLPIEEAQKFPEEVVRKIRHYFQEAMDSVFPQTPGEPIHVPPIIFISLTDSCETILNKVQEAPVACGNLQLHFDPSTCADCGMKIGEVGGEKVACCFGEDWSDAVPYNESTCHPLFVPKHSTFDKFRDCVVYVVTFQWARGRKWPIFEGEVCVRCREEPNSRGCTQVGQEFQLPKQGETITVNHTNQLVETVVVNDQVQNGVRENGEQQEQ